MIKKRISALQTLLKEKKIDVYIIPTADYHNSEYVCEFFKSREYMSGFTGSAGTLVVTQTEALLWTDGRYFIQAANELKDSNIVLMKQGVENVPTIFEFVNRYNVIGFDGKTITKNEGFRYEFLKKNVLYNEDLVNRLWEDRPSIQSSNAYLLDKEYCGVSYEEKIRLVRKQMERLHCNTHILTSLDDIAWLLNLRGNDIPNNPVNLAYLILTDCDTTLYIKEDKLNKTIIDSLNISIKDYNDIYEDVKDFNGKSILIDGSKINFFLYKLVEKNNKICDKPNPTNILKAIKNEIEIKCIRKSHLKDGIAVTKFMCWLKTNVGRLPMDECNLAERLEEERKKQPLYVEPSFNSIVAYKDHGAMMHYSATKESAYKITNSSFLLIDSGGQYLDGTTDITRTFALGNISKEEKTNYTLVLKGMIALASAQFLHGCRGINLDILARNNLWKQGIDYQCGTGHGVGFFLNVHEGPNSFRYQNLPDRADCILEHGMVTTDEPGVYIEGKYGIRLENELLCLTSLKNIYGQFMKFETLTLVPIDLDGIDVALLDKNEIDWLNKYHQTVYEKIAPFLDSKEQLWLKKYTRKI